VKVIKTKGKERHKIHYFTKEKKYNMRIMNASLIADTYCIYEYLYMFIECN